MKSAKAIEQWVNENREFLLTLDSNEDWLAMIWALFSEQSDDKFFHALEPNTLAFQLATQWLQGSHYLALFAHSSTEEGSKPWGATQRRKLTEDEIVEFCESTLGFECSLLLAAVAQFLFGENGIDDERSAALTLFQKALKYGLPDWPSISCYEFGFADRVIAQRLNGAARSEGFSGKIFASALESHRELIEATLKDYPSYFESVLASRVRP